MIPWISALTLIAPVALTDGETPAPVAATESPKLFGEISLQEQFPVVDDMRVGGLLRAYYDYADSELSTDGDNVAGFRFYDAQVWFQAELHGYELFLRADAGNASAFPLIDPDSGLGEIEFLDAYVRKSLNENFAFFFGQFKCPLVSSGNIGDGNLAMIERTRIGQLFSMPGAYQPGAAVTYDGGPFHAKVVLQNGADSASDGNGIVVRGEYKIGSGQGIQEGALGKPDGFNATFGLGYFMDDSDLMGEDFGSAWAADAYATINHLSLHAEVLAADEELAGNALGNADEDALPYSATVGYLFHENWEGFVRYQDLDNDADATLIGGGVNYYVAEHSAKWQLNVSQYDDDAVDGLIAQIGFAIGLSQPSTK